MSLSEKHIHAFGIITYEYAHCEVHLKFILGGLLGLSIEYVFIASEPYGALDLRNVAKSIAKISDLSDKDRDRLLSLIGRLGSFGALRNNIAHSMWKSGAPWLHQAYQNGYSIRQSQAYWALGR